MERTSYAAGTPSWVDIGSTDLDVTHAFYTALFGWEPVSAGPDAGGYGMYTLRGKEVAGYGPAQAPGVWWTTYVTVDDADATTSYVGNHGGTIVVEPVDVFEAGRMAVYVDPTGAAFSAWQPRGTIGCELVNEPGAFSWAELMTHDVPTASMFYGAVFGWVDKAGPDAPYHEWCVGDAVVAGGTAIGEDMTEVPAHWNVYFGTADVDASAARVAELGGSVRVPPFDVEGVGRMAVVGGPHGEGFSLFGF